LAEIYENKVNLLKYCNGMMACKIRNAQNEGLKMSILLLRHLIVWK